MSTSLAKAGRLKPEIRLGQAISEFQADLSLIEKTTFRAHQTSGTPPEIRDVMQLTAEINRSSGLHGRCFGPRLTNILQSVQQFAALGDIVLGGTQNLLACGVWSAVRMTFLSIVNYSAYFERLSSMLMAAGRSAPRYQLMGAIYPKSVALQTCMLEYFIVLVKLCHHVLQINRKSAIGQWASTLVDSLDTYQYELELWATSIKDEVNLLTAQQFSVESKKNSRFRSHVYRHLGARSHAEGVKARKRILDACSMYDHERDWKQIRKLGNTDLMKNSTAYGLWKKPARSVTAGSKTLVWTGKLGSGKSVLLANIVDDLNIDATQGTTVAYFFCQHDATDSLAARTVIGSLARQLLHPGINLDCASDFLDERGSLSLDRVVGLLQHLLPTGHQAYFVLDGLMHCDLSERRLILDKLQSLQEVRSLAVCISHREEPSYSLQELDQLVNMTTLPITDQSPEIKRFIKRELDRCIDSGELVVRDPLLVDEIETSLAEGAQGMFLWVSLQMKALCLQQTDAEIRTAIANLPKDLSAIYQLILQKSQPVEYQARILGFVMTACRPLHTEELREALSVIPGLTVWNPQRLLNDIKRTLACCGGLITINEEDFSIRMIHHSVRTFLCEYEGSRKFDLKLANQTMAETIVTYLNYGVFSRQVSTFKAPSISANTWTSAAISSAASHNFVLRLLRPKKVADTNIGHVLYGFMGQQQQDNSSAPLEFYQYATCWWQEHVWSLDLQDPRMQTLLVKLLRTQDLDKPDLYGRTPLSHASEQGYCQIVDTLLALGAQEVADRLGRTAMHWAVEGKHTSVVKSLLGSDEIDPNAKDHSGQTPTTIAIQAGHKPVLECILQCPRVALDYRDQNGRSLLMAAAAGGSEDAVHMLLIYNKQPEDLDKQGNTPLHAAAACGNTEVICRLLEFEHTAGAVNFKNHSGHTPLWLAAANGHETSVWVLMSHRDTDHDLHDLRNGSPFWIAAANGHLGVIRIFLKFNKIHRYSEILGCSAVEIAAENGHVRVVNLLARQVSVTRDQLNSSLWRAATKGHEAVISALSTHHGVNINCKNRLRLTPLWVAASKGHEDVVKTLIAIPGVDLNYRNAKGSTPLLTAAAHGHERIVRILAMAGGTHLNSKNASGMTALGKAVSNGHEGVVKALIGNPGVDLNSKNDEGETPLWISASNNMIDIVHLLCSKQAIAVNIPDNEGRTALWIAACRGHEVVVRILASHRDIDFNCRDKSMITPLEAATANGHADVVSILAGLTSADLNQVDARGLTPLFKAAQGGHADVVKLLLSSRSLHDNHLTETHAAELSSLLTAVRADNLSVVKAFLSCPRFVKSFSNSDAFAALGAASYLEHSEIADVLLEFLSLQ